MFLSMLVAQTLCLAQLYSCTGEQYTGICTVVLQILRKGSKLGVTLAFLSKECTHFAWPSKCVENESSKFVLTFWLKQTNKHIHTQTPASFHIDAYFPQTLSLHPFYPSQHGSSRRPINRLKVFLLV